MTATMDAPLHDASPEAWLIWSDWLQEYGKGYWAKNWRKVRRIGLALSQRNRLILVGEDRTDYGTTVIHLGPGNINWSSYANLRWWTDRYARVFFFGQRQNPFLAQPSDFPELVKKNRPLAWLFFHNITRTRRTRWIR